MVKGENIPEPGVPESFKVLIKELQALCLNVKVLNDDNEEIKLKESVEDDAEELDINIEGTEEFVPSSPTEEYVEADEESEDDIDVDYDDLPLDDLQGDLGIDDFNEEQ